MHLQVRDPQTGKGSRGPALFRETVDRVRQSGVDVVIKLTAGMGGDWTPAKDNRAMPGPGTEMTGPDERLAHVKDCLPGICSPDCGTLNFGNDDKICISTPPILPADPARRSCAPILRRMAALIKEWGVKPELEVFGPGHGRFAKAMHAEGLLADPPMFQLCLGIPWGADQPVEIMAAMKAQLPPGASWASFGISRMQMPMAAATVALGGNVRVGLEDNLFLDRGVLATNARLVTRARIIIESLGARVLTPQEARCKLNLRGSATRRARTWPRAGLCCAGWSSAMARSRRWPGSALKSGGASF